MTESQHIAVASLLSKLTGNPIVAFIVGFASHAVLDIIEPQEHKINIRKDTDMILLEVLLSATMIIMFRGNPVILCGIIGGILPDVIDGTLSIINRDRYMTGNHLFWFHRPRDSREMSKKVTMLVSIVLTFVVLIGG